MKNIKKIFNTSNTLMIILTIWFIGQSIYDVVIHFTKPEAQTGTSPWFMSIIIRLAVLAAGIVIWRVVIAILNKKGK